jgi:hypothetical protein
MERLSLRTLAIALSAVLVSAVTLGSLTYTDWSWTAVVSMYVALVVLGPTISAWWRLWNQHHQNPRR